MLSSSGPVGRIHAYGRSHQGPSKPAAMRSGAANPVPNMSLHRSVIARHVVVALGECAGAQPADTQEDHHARHLAHDHAQSQAPDRRPEHV